MIIIFLIHAEENMIDYPSMMDHHTMMNYPKEWWNNNEIHWQKLKLILSYFTQNFMSAIILHSWMKNTHLRWYKNLSRWKRWKGNPFGFLLNVLDCDIAVIESKVQSSNYAFFGQCPWEMYEPLISSAME